MFERLPLWLRKTLAWSVHLFTGTGAVWGFLTLLAIWESNFKLAILYMIVAMFVDGFDGMLARWFHVKDLPEAAVAYINRIAALCDVPVKLASVGPERQQIVEL